MTTLPAAVFGLKDRGQLRAGAFADVLFDLSKVNDGNETRTSLRRHDDIIVNGEQRGVMGVYVGACRSGLAARAVTSCYRSISSSGR